MPRLTPILATFSLLLTTAQAADRLELKNVRTFMIQTGKLESVDAINRLAQSPYDLLVIDTMSTVKPTASVDMKPVLAKLREGKPNRIILCYLDLAEAESYRTYWQDNWKAPSWLRNPKPDFILFPDPDGWSDNYPVAYWDPRWKDLIATGPSSVVKHLMAEGFDGLYLDWVQGHADPKVAAVAKKQNVDPDKSMVDLIAAVRAEVRNANPAGLVVAQNGAYLIDRDPRFPNVIDGICFEHTWFAGKPDTAWNDSDAGDIPNPAADRLVQQYKKYLAANRPVFTLDYCLKPANAAKVYQLSRNNGFVPLVTQSSLEGVTTTPPPAENVPPTQERK